MLAKLLRFLIMNRNGTKIGKWTWLCVIIWFFVLAIHTIFVHILGWLSLSDTETPVTVLMLILPAMLLLNRFDV